MRRIQLTYQTKFGLLFISPAALYFAGFWVLPVALAVVASATDWRIGRPAHFIGLSNYAGLVSDPQLRQTFGAAAAAFVRPRFGVDGYVHAVTGLYDRLLAAEAARA